MQTNESDNSPETTDDDEPSTTFGLPTSRLLALIGVVVVAGIAVAALLFPDGDKPGGSADELALSELPFTNDDGSTGTLADYEGAPLVVNFFAAWCGPCRAEIPDFEAVHQAAGDDVRILGVSHDFDEASWRSFVNEVELTYPTVFQPTADIWEQLDLFGTPATIFVTPEGEVVHTFTGPLDEERLTALIDEHLDVEI